MRINNKKIVPVLISLSLLASIAVAGTGCAAGSSAEEEEEVVTVYVTNVDPYAGSEAEGTASATASSADAAASSAAAGTGAFPAAVPATGSTAGEAAENAATGTGAFPAAVPVSGSTAAKASENAAAGSSAARASAASGASTSDIAVPEETDGPASTAAEAATDETPFALDGGTDVYAEPEEETDVPGVRSEDDTPLKESVLYEALSECTGWGQSAGSSLRAAYAATKLLYWANQADAAAADAGQLEEAVAAQVKEFSPEERSTIQSNWSSISYDASMILDDYDEISYLLEDAGCSETAKEAAQDKNALDNWKAAEKALKAALK